MNRPLFLFVLVFSLVASKVHADLITYTMTGTIKDAQTYTTTSGLGLTNPGSGPAPVAVGDHISWTLQYDRSTPASSSLSPTGGIVSSATFYSPSGPLITNLVDRTNGFHMYTAPPGSIPTTSLALVNFPTSGHVQLGDGVPSSPPGGQAYSVQLNLTSRNPLPTMNLAKLQLDHLPLQFNDTSPSAAFQFFYSGQVPHSAMHYQFDAQFDSLSASASTASTPEPSTLLLGALGAAGFLARRFCRVFGRAG